MKANGSEGLGWRRDNVGDAQGETPGTQQSGVSALDGERVISSRSTRPWARWQHVWVDGGKQAPGSTCYLPLSAPLA